MKNTFKGAATALITPMKDGGKIDYAAFEALIEDQIKNDIDALVVCGTTGESATLDDKEHRELIKFCVDKVDKRVPVIAGTGSNDTRYAIDLSAHACEMGADMLLLVTPYYNKTTQRGLIKHFEAVAEVVDKPMILYNVPSRTGLNILPETYKELSYNEKIVAAKEANGNISAVAETIALCGDRLDIISGNDDQIVPIMALGGVGVISVLSNVVPKETHEMCKLMLEGKVKEAAALQLKYLPLINALFCETNPIPAKAAMAELGFCGEDIRLPLCEMSEGNRAKMVQIMKEAGIKF
ncbi:MAG: 4-hydroxy-tetrahydrodipicolinate synthase [Ruminococcaceae bacterium]|nr:4-hydroxy-tetrahydrodipicolinate synthase [Oscillospiraceae bacterium]